MPSKDELNLIYVNLVKTGIIKSDSTHWSSSQYSDSNAWRQMFSGYQYDGNKIGDYCVRAVRAF